MVILGYALLVFGALIVIGNMTGGGLIRPQAANARLIAGIALASFGAYLAFG